MKVSCFFIVRQLLFSNIQLIDEEHLAYADRVFSYLNEGPIYWDDYSRASEFVARHYNRNNPFNKTLSSESPLQYILSQPPLAWAWYLLLGLGFLYLIFRGKRKQRIIPVLEENKNTSLEFLSTIGRLYFLRNNHKELAIQKMKLYLAFIRERYHIQTKALDAAFIKRLAVKSEIQEEKIDQLLMLSKNIHNSNYVSEVTLIDFHNKIDHFYKNCK